MGIQICANAPDAEGVGDNDNFCTCKHVNGIMHSTSCPMTGCRNIHYHDRAGPVARASQGLPTAGEPGGTLTASPGTINRQIDGKPHYVNVHNPLSESCLVAPHW